MWEAKHAKFISGFCLFAWNESGGYVTRMNIILTMVLVPPITSHDGKYLTDSRVLHPYALPEEGLSESTIEHYCCANHHFTTDTDGS